MITGSNKERLEQEIANLIGLISKGRLFFFQKTGLSLKSSNNWFDHWKSKDLFQAHFELRQLELNIQLFYIKLSSYYELTSNKQMTKGVKKQRHVFAHGLTDIIFNKRVKYNFFLHNVTENLKKVKIIFYDENESKDEGIVVLDLDLDKDINDFIKSWTKLEKEI